MTIANGDKLNHSGKKKILWVSSLILDVHLHKTSQLEILKHLAKRGYNTTLLAMRSKDVFSNENSQVRVISIPLRYVPVVSPVIYIIVLSFFLPIYVVVSKPDFVITEPDFSFLGSISALPFSKFKRVKFILDVRSTPVETVGFRGLLETFCFAASVLIAKSTFDGTTIISSPMKEEVCQRFSIDRKLVGVWSSGVSTTSFKPENFVSEGTTLRRRFGLANRFVVFYHGAFRPSGGLTETIEAMKIIKHSHPNVFLFLLGTGSIVSDLKQLIQKEEIRDNVIVHDQVEYSEIPKYIAMCDVGIVPLPNLPYWRFQCPLKLLEYLAMEKVAIVTDIPAHRLIIGTEKCGIYISSVKPIEIAKSILYAYRNKEKLEVWGKSGRTIIEEKYSWEKVAKNFETYLLSIR
jgi:glycosyltransferase involved in cell wall biosynthesis